LHNNSDVHALGSLIPIKMPTNNTLRQAVIIVSVKFEPTALSEESVLTRNIQAEGLFILGTPRIERVESGRE